MSSNGSSLAPQSVRYLDSGTSASDNPARRRHALQQPPLMPTSDPGSSRPQGGSWQPQKWDFVPSDDVPPPPLAHSQYGSARSDRSSERPLPQQAQTNSSDPPQSSGLKPCYPDAYPPIGLVSYETCESKIGDKQEVSYKGSDGSAYHIKKRGGGNTAYYVCQWTDVPRKFGSYTGSNTAVLQVLKGGVRMERGKGNIFYTNGDGPWFKEEPGESDLNTPLKDYKSSGLVAFNEIEVVSDKEVEEEDEQEDEQDEEGDEDDSD